MRPSAPRAPKKGSASALLQLEQVHAADRAAWRRWLAAWHDKSPGIWLIFEKTTNGVRPLPYADAVEEALCFGWIDSTTRPLDDRHYMQLFAPRNPRSSWSRLNKERVARMVEQDLMAAPGIAKVEDAKRSGAWSRLDDVEAFIMPPDLEAALACDPVAARNFAAFPRSARKSYLAWVASAKRAETRARRVAAVVSFAARNQKVPSPRS